MLFFIPLASVCACVYLAPLPQTTDTSPSRPTDSFAFSQAESSHGCCRLAVHLRVSRHLFIFAFQTTECCCGDYTFCKKPPLFTWWCMNSVADLARLQEPHTPFERMNGNSLPSRHGVHALVPVLSRRAMFSLESNVNCGWSRGKHRFFSSQSERLTAQ